MIKFLIGVFVFLFVIPSMIFSIGAYFEQKKEAKNPKAKPRPHNLTHAQMMDLIREQLFLYKHACWQHSGACAGLKSARSSLLTLTGIQCE